MRRLPSLASLEAFLAVARLHSVKTAAASLGLSAPALSRRITALEARLGYPLFDRRHQAMVLNDAGIALNARVAPILDDLAAALDGTGDGARMRLGVLPLFATQRLIPRLPALRALHPDLHLDLDTAPNALARLGEGLDAAIVLAEAIDPALHARRLDHDRVFAIAAHDVAARVRDPAGLATETVIIHRDLPDTFDAWRRALDQPTLTPAAIEHYDSGQLMLDAAAQGLGVAFLHESHLTHAHDTRLTRLFDVAVASPYSYWFTCRPRALRLPAVRRFADWLAGGGLNA